MEIVLLLLAGLMGIAGFVGGVWIAIIAFKNDEPVMGVLSFCCAIVAIIYGVQNMGECRIPLILVVIGVIGSILSNVVSMMIQ